MALRQHGLWNTPEYRSWSQMKARCLNPKAQNYHLYGGRGIKICAQWLNSFPTFLADMGKRPSLAYSLDRINNNGNYEPTNCKWSTATEQSNNRRKRVGRVFNHCKYCNTTYSVIRARADGSNYCSKACARLARRSRVILACGWCEKEMERWTSAASKHNFCSNTCKNFFYWRLKKAS